ncbi:hypothetical protein [Williamsia sp. D3]|nr:hypothetical protein [Williamsia sp. D3]
MPWVVFVVLGGEVVGGEMAGGELAHSSAAFMAGDRLAVVVEDPV